MVVKLFVRLKNLHAQKSLPDVIFYAIILLSKINMVCIRMPIMVRHYDKHGELLFARLQIIPSKTMKG